MPAAPAPAAALVPVQDTDTCPRPTGLWSPACELQDAPLLGSLQRRHIWLFFLQQIDWCHQRTCVFCLGLRRTWEEKRSSLDDSSPRSERGWKEERVGNGWPYQTTTIHCRDHVTVGHMVPLPRHIHICTIKKMKKKTNKKTLKIHTHWHPQQQCNGGPPWPDV